MNIKRYLTNPRSIGTALVHRMTWLPDETYLKLLFYFEMGYRLNLNNPRTFQEKVQWLKLYNRKAEFVQMVDKYAVKDYVANIIGQQYIIPTIGVWNSPGEIDYDSLPEKFVLKTTHGGGGCGVIICKNKEKFDKKAAVAQLTDSLKYDIYKHYREWPYKDVPKRIIAEKMLEVPNAVDLADYKVFCFNGEPKFIQVIQDRRTCETIDFFDAEWNHLEFYGLINRNVKQAKRSIPKPNNLNEMLKAARLLAKDKDFVRVDLYEVENHIYFGELTFYPASGFGTFMPQEWNTKMGDLLKLPQSAACGGGVNI